MPMLTNHSSVPEQSTTSFWKYNRPGISWALLILVLSSITTPSFRIPDLFDLFAPDKIAHFVFYAVYVVLFYRGFAEMPVNTVYHRNQFSIPLLSGILYGGLIELYQGYFLPNRTADYVDFIANTIGALIGWGVARWMSKRRVG